MKLSATDGYTRTVSDELATYITLSKYSGYLPGEQRRETWQEIVKRDENMHLDKFAYLGNEFQNEIRRAFDFVYDKRVLPSMRSLQFAGPGVLAHNARLFNCAVRHIDSITAFKELFYLLLCGCGVGMGITDRHLSKLPNMVSYIDEILEFEHVIDDTIEGWAEALEMLLFTFTEGNEFSHKKINFDYSIIRPKGALLKTSGGRAPGPDGLRENLEKIRSILYRAMYENNNGKLRTVDAYDIMMFASEAVLSGGIRRAATSVVFAPSDDLMMKAKSGNWHPANPQRANSNNSALFLRKDLTHDAIAQLVAVAREWGEPGFVFADDIDTLFNPCFEIAFLPITKDGECGVQFCNLTTINAGKITSEQDWRDAAEAATFIGTLQASYTDFPFLTPAAKTLTEDEALLGVSMTAMADCRLVFDRLAQRRVAEHTTAVNAKVADTIGINRAARITCVKPEGTSTLVVGSQASGIHPSHERYMLRRITANKQDPVFQHFKKFNSHLVEPKNETDEMIVFPIEVSAEAVLKADLPALIHLELVKDTQLNWVKGGETDRNYKGLSHNVSCTVIVNDDEWSDVTDYLFDNKDDFTAVSLLAATGDKDYKQPPLEGMRTYDEIVTFKHLQNSFRPVDWSTYVEAEDGTVRNRELACSGGVCEISF